MSRAEVRKRYQQELRAESVEPPVFAMDMDLRCSVCGKPNAPIVHGSVRRGDVVRYCGGCEPGRAA